MDWPLLIPVDEATPDRIARAVERCLSGDLDDALENSLRRAREGVADVRGLFVNQLGTLSAVAGGMMP